MNRISNTDSAAGMMTVPSLESTNYFPIFDVDNWNEFSETLEKFCALNPNPIINQILDKYRFFCYSVLASRLHCRCIFWEIIDRLFSKTKHR